jgi:hypothetical protein
MLVACRLAGLSALEAYYEGVRASAQCGAARGCEGSSSTACGRSVAPGARAIPTSSCAWRRMREAKKSPARLSWRRIARGKRGAPARGHARLAHMLPHGDGMRQRLGRQGMDFWRRTVQVLEVSHAPTTTAEAAAIIG